MVFRKVKRQAFRQLHWIAPTNDSWVNIRCRLRDCYCTVNGMLPIFSRTANIKVSIFRYKIFRNLYLITGNSPNHSQFTSGYPQFWQKMFTFFKSLTPCRNRNSHTMCERKRGLKFGDNAGKSRFRLGLILRQAATKKG